MATVSRNRLPMVVRGDRIVVATQPQRTTERPLWQVIGALYAGIVVLTALVITLAFSMARLLA